MKFISLLLIVLALTACASFKGEKVAQQSLYDQSAFQNKPSVYINIEAKSNLPNYNGSQLVERVKNRLQVLLDTSQIFSSFTFDRHSPEKMDYTLNIEIRNDGDMAAAQMAGFLTGYTLGVIPTYATDNYAVRTVLYKDGEQLTQFKEADHMKTWFGIWFIPISSSNKPENVSMQVIENLIVRGLNKLIDDEQLEYSYKFKIIPVS